MNNSDSSVNAVNRDKDNSFINDVVDGVFNWYTSLAWYTYIMTQISQ